MSAGSVSGEGLQMAASLVSMHGLFAVQAQREKGAGPEKKGGREKRKERAISSSFYIGASQVALVVKNPSANVRDAGEARHVGSIPGSERSPGEANGNPLQYSCLENPMDRGTWWALIHGVRESDMTQCTHTFIKPPILYDQDPFCDLIYP